MWVHVRDRASLAWQTVVAMRFLSLLPIISLLFLSGPLAGCAADSNNVESDSSNLDTSGCSTSPRTLSQGSVGATALVPPWKSCWNIDEGFVVARYSWTQENDAQPQKSNIGFWTEINGVGVFEKAASYHCDEIHGLSMGHDTSGRTTYRCAAEKQLTFRNYPELRDAGYNEGGTRRSWDVAIAVALDDDGHWDSQNGANYHFSF